MQDIYNTQAFHFGIGEIERLARVVPADEAMPHDQFALVPQSYDNNRYQTIFSRMIEDRLSGIRARQRDPVELRERRTLGALRRIVDHAYRHVPFYRQLYSSAGFSPGDIRSLKDFEALPIISKSDLAASKSGALTTLRSRSSSYLSRTSGSSGEPLDYRYGTPKCFFEMANYLLMCESAKGAPLDPDRWIYNIHNARWWLSSLQGRYRTFAVADMPSLDAFDKHIRLLRPEILVTPPSHLTKIREAREALIDAGVRAITTNSEQSTAAERRSAEAVLGVPVRDEYSSTELGSMAFEREDGRYAIFEDSVYLEVPSRDASGVGELIGTRLTNRVMPTIRYRQGDYAAIDDQAPDGRGYRHLNAIHGKINSSFRRDGGVIPSGSILAAIDEYIVDRESHITDIQLIQKTHRDIDILLVSPRGPNWSAVEALKMNIDRLFGHAMVYRVEVLDVIPNKTSFKRKTLICEVE